MSTKDWRFLVVEDEPDGQEVVKLIMLHHGIQFDAAMNAEEAIALMQNQQYTAAILDLALPGMDGWGLLKYIQSDPQTAQMPCLAITAFHSAEVAVEAVHRGFAAYFPKPLDATSFVREIDRVLRERA